MDKVAEDIDDNIYIFQPWTWFTLIVMYREMMTYGTMVSKEWLTRKYVSEYVDYEKYLKKNHPLLDNLLTLTQLANLLSGSEYTRYGIWKCVLKVKR